MPVDLESQILKVLSSMKPGDRPATFGDLARRFGLSAGLISGYARQLVDKGMAAPSMVIQRGVPTLHGLLPLPVAPPKVPAESSAAAEQ
jgi:hypothetical protein